MGSNVNCRYFHNKQVNFHVGALHTITISTAYSTLCVYVCTRAHVCVLIFLKETWNLCSHIHIMLTQVNRVWIVAQQNCIRNKTSGLCKLPAPNQSHLYIWSTHTQCSPSVPSELTLAFFFHTPRLSLQSVSLSWPLECFCTYISYLFICNTIT